jgi:hypothetical protein
MKREKPVSLIGHYVDGPEFERLLRSSQDFVRQCMNNRFVLTDQEQITLFGISQRIEECIWEHGIYPEQPEPLDIEAETSPKLRKLLKSIKEDFRVDQE